MQTSQQNQNEVFWHSFHQFDTRELKTELVKRFLILLQIPFFLRQSLSLMKTVQFQDSISTLSLRDNFNFDFEGHDLALEAKVAELQRNVKELGEFKDKTTRILKNLFNDFKECLPSIDFEKYQVDLENMKKTIYNFLTEGSIFFSKCDFPDECGKHEWWKMRSTRRKNIETEVEKIFFYSKEACMF